MRAVAAMALMAAGLAAQAIPPVKGEFAKGFASLESHEYIQARKAAEQLIREAPDSPEGWLLYSLALRDGDGQLAQAYRGLNIAMSKGTQPSEIHERILRELADTAGLVDRYEEQVRIMQLHDSMYAHAFETRIGWPLMKIGRGAEATQRMLEIAERGEASERISALNTLGSIAWEDGDLRGSYEYFKRASSLGESIVVNTNLGEAALSLRRFGEGERVLLDNARRHESYGFGNPWLYLIGLYTLEGRLAEALSSAPKLAKWYAGGPAWLNDQSSDDRSCVLVEVLLATGYDAEALAASSDARSRLGRRGIGSTGASRVEATVIGHHLEALRMARERAREERSWTPFWQFPRLWWRELTITVEMALDRRRAAALLVKDGSAAMSVGPYTPGAPTPEWLRAPAGEWFGAAAERQAREQRLSAEPSEAPYHKLAQGEMDLAAGHLAEARHEFEEALENLPPEEVLLRGRAQTLEAIAFDRGGDLAKALPLYAGALRTSPRMFRVMGASLPVELDSDGSPEAARLIRMLARSVRFRRVEGQSLKVRAWKDGSRLSVSLNLPDGSVYARVDAGFYKGADDAVLQACRDFHDRVFKSRVDLTQQSPESLDGSNLSR